MFIKEAKYEDNRHPQLNSVTLVCLLVYSGNRFIHIAHGITLYQLRKHIVFSSAVVVVVVIIVIVVGAVVVVVVDVVVIIVVVVVVDICNCQMEDNGEP